MVRSEKMTSKINAFFKIKYKIQWVYSVEMSGTQILVLGTALCPGIERKCSFVIDETPEVTNDDV